MNKKIAKECVKNPAGEQGQTKALLPDGFDFFADFVENNPGITDMKDLFKSFLTIMLISAAFVVGFQLGKEKEKEKIPKFQEDHGDIGGALD